MIWVKIPVLVITVADGDGPTSCENLKTSSGVLKNIQSVPFHLLM